MLIRLTMYAKACCLSVLLAMAPLGSTPASIGSGPNAAADAWLFRVYLDDHEIGYHHFYLDDSGSERELLSEASFEYRLLFIKLFQYEHRNREIWNGNCLQRIESRTDSNGRPFHVRGQLESGRFQVDGTAGEATLPECVMSFAYWNPAFLRQGRLLNTQNGEFLDVEISPPVPEMLKVRGEQLDAYRYRVQADDLQLDLWYSTNNEWLALESEVEGGRTLRYELL